MPEKRKSAGRRRSEGTPSKKIQTISKQTIPRLKETYSDARAEDSLPTRVSGSKPLPVTSKNQSFAPEALKGIAESGVLAASIERSRTQWITEGLFERYWIKPRKKKDQPDMSNNPDIKTMQRLGLCRIIIEPHVFEAVLFTIKDIGQASKPLMKPPQAPSMLPSGNTPTTQLGTAPSSNQSTPAPVSQLPQVPQVTCTPNNNPKTMPSSQPAPTPSPVPPQQAVSSKPGQDPVIQMLAQRASKDPGLKSLMQIVASGAATQDQLAIFQSHINDLNAILQRQQSTSQTTAASTTIAPHQPAVKQEGGLPANIAPSSFRNQTPTFAMSPMQQPPIASSQSARPSPAPFMQPQITGIAVEFIGGTVDRFLLPRNSIYDYDNARKQVLLSFLITKKAHLGDGARFEANKEYYQPITIRIGAESREQARIFDSISRTLASAEDVRKHMNETMARATRAETLPLALQLPRTSELVDDSSAPPTPINGRTADRRHSLLKQSTVPSSRASPALERSALEEQHCMLCFEPVMAPTQKLEGKTVCPSCALLRRKALNSMPMRGADLGTTMAHAMGPATLML